MPRPAPHGALRPVQFRLGAADLARADRIVQALMCRGRRGERTAAVRWALAELDCRLAIESGAGKDAALTLSPAGPATAPPAEG